MDHQHDGFVTSPACSVFLFIDSLLCQWNHHLWFTESIEETGVVTFTTSSHAWSFGVSGVLWVCFLFFCHYCLDCAFCRGVSHWQQIPSHLAVGLFGVIRILLCMCMGSLLMWCVSPPGGVLLPSGVSGSDSGGGDAHQTSSGQGRAGEVSAVQRHLHRPQERKGRHQMKTFWLQRDYYYFPQSAFKCSRFYVSSPPHLMLSSLALLFMSDQEVLALHLVLHLPVLQKVNSMTITENYST